MGIQRLTVLKNMKTLLIVGIALLALVAAQKNCAKRIKNFEDCLKKGFRSELGCKRSNKDISDKNKRQCTSLEVAVTDCGYTCPSIDKCRREDVEFYGAHFVSFQSKGFEDCFQYCQNSVDCVSFTLQKSNNFCWLKNKRGGSYAKVRAGFDSMNMDCDDSNIDYSCKREQTNTYGSFGSFKASGFEQCAELCRESADCKAITVRRSDGYCWFKNKLGGTGAHPNAAYDSMNMDCGRSSVDLDACTFESTNYIAATLTHFRSQGIEDCVDYCRDTEDCSGIVLRKSDNWCWLRNKASVNKGPQPDTRYNSVILNCNKDPKDYRENCLRESVNTVGSIRAFASSGSEQCAELCRQTENCKSITVRKSDNHCWLKNKDGGTGAHPSAAYNSMNLDCSNKKVDLESFTVENSNYIAATLTHFKSQGIEDCANYCRDTEDCSGVVVRKSDNWCWLRNKASVNKGPQPDTRYDSVIFGGKKNVEPYREKCLMEGVNTVGQFRNFQSSGPEQCAEICRRTEGCKSITVRKSDEWCWLKNKIGGTGAHPNAAYDSMNMDCDDNRGDVDLDACTFENTNYIAATLTNFKSQGIEDCANYCRNTEDCSGVVVRKSDNWCWLRNKASVNKGPQPDTKYDSVILNCNKDRKDFRDNCLREGAYSQGPVIRHFKTTGPVQCAEFCRATEGCKSILLRKSDEWCWLRNSNGGTGAWPHASYDIMNLDCDNKPVDDSCVREHMNFIGADIKAFKSESFEDCGNFCRDTESCQAITFRYSDGYCWLKNKADGTGPKPNMAYKSLNMNC